MLFIKWIFEYFPDLSFSAKILLLQEVLWLSRCRRLLFYLCLNFEIKHEFRKITTIYNKRAPLVLCVCTEKSSINLGWRDGAINLEAEKNVTKLGLKSALISQCIEETKLVKEE